MMFTRRLLAVPQPRRARLAPIYFAFGLLALLSALELLVASWPRASEPPADPRPVERAAAPSSPAFEGSQRLPPEPSPPRHRTHRM